MNTKISEYLNCNKSMSFNELLFSFIDESGHKDPEIYKKVDIDRKLFSKIRCDSDYIPRRNVIIKLCLALELERKEFNKLLNSAGYSLTNNNYYEFSVWVKTSILGYYAKKRQTNTIKHISYGKTYWNGCRPCRL